MPKTVQELIETSMLEFYYDRPGENSGNGYGLQGVSLTIRKGEFVAIVGRNGSGKSTLAQLLNALLAPTGGSVRINGIDTTDSSQLWDIRRQCGMIFQCPDNQIVGATVLEDIAFGPENLGIPPEHIEQRVRQALRAVTMLEHADSPPDTLSASQKQKVCMAALLAMEPACLILDESTAMLDQSGKADIMTLLRRLNRDEKLTVLHCTHDMEEALLADRVIVLEQGRVRADGTPAELLADPFSLRRLGLELPPFAELLDMLRRDGHDLPPGIASAEDALRAITALLDSARHHVHTA